MPRWKAAAKLLADIKALSIVIWRQGIKDTRDRFWRYMVGMARQNPALLEQFLVVLAHSEHFLEYRSIMQRKSASSWNHCRRKTYSNKELQTA